MFNTIIIVSIGLDNIVKFYVEDRFVEILAVKSTYCYNICKTFVEA